MAQFDDKIVIIGFGNIGQAIIPLLAKHFPTRRIWIIERAIGADQVTIIKDYNLHSIATRIAKDNYQEILTPLLEPGDFLLNLAHSVSSRSLIELAQSLGAFYVDTCIDPWEYTHSQHGIDTSNYALRERIRELRATSEAK